jgi:ABC-type sugar transport system permease subunit
MVLHCCQRSGGRLSANFNRNSRSADNLPVGLSRGQKLRENLTGYLFIFPSVLIIGIFGLFPIAYAIYMSTINWRMVKGSFIGLANYQKALGSLPGILIFMAGLALIVAAFFVWNRATRAAQTSVFFAGLLTGLVMIAAGWVLSTGWSQMIATGDQHFLDSLPITLYYSIGSVPLELFLGLVIAYILFQKIRGKEFFRMLYFLPYVTPAIAAAAVFTIIFSPKENSLANTILSWFRLKPLNWIIEANPVLSVLFGARVTGFLAGPSLALVTVIIFSIWSFVGYNVVIFLAGLGGIPREIYEAAEMDGASAWQMFRSVTIPLISPVTFYLALVAFIGTFKAFNHIYVMRTPNALGTMDVASVTIFDTFYKLNNYGYAAAQAVILFLIIAGLTYAQNQLFSEKVFYG